MRKSNKYIEKSGDTEGRNEVERTTFFRSLSKKLVMQDKGTPHTWLQLPGKAWYIMVFREHICVHSTLIKCFYVGTKCDTILLVLNNYVVTTYGGDNYP